MDISRPFSALSPSVDLNVLVVLAGSSVPRSGREIARRSGRSKTGVQHVLERLVRHGLVDRLQAGNASLYSLNREHLLAPAVEQMVEARVELIRRLRGQIEGWEIAASHASLFGSAARGDGGPDSDIDLLIVRPSTVGADNAVWRAQIDELAEHVLRWSGNLAGVVEISEQELPRLRRQRPPVLAHVQEEAVDLAGESARRVFASPKAA